MIEHHNVTAKVICDRGVTHEIVRHRIASYSQESTRYCNYAGKEMEFIEPCFWRDGHEMTFKDLDLYNIWKESLGKAEESYNKLIELGAKPEEARSVLPNSLKTEIVMTMNLREWRHFLRIRCDKASHPQMREVAILLLIELSNAIPVVFEDILEKHMEKANVEKKIGEDSKV